ncbi:MAG: Crp/Fnr family transcriptional regulator [Bacteroidetes bacterium]|nr:Crp/Fnr family transcriptional regulator [Bacteroidota bacterium]
MINQVFPSFEKELIDDIEKLSSARFYNTGEILLRKSDTVRNITIILQGSAKAFQSDDAEGEFVIAYLKAGNSFGVSISDDSPETAKRALISIAAIEPTHVLQMSFADKDMLARKYDRWYKYILQTSVQYYGFYLDLIDSIAFRKLDERIEFFLKRFSEVKNSNTLQISHQEIAKSLNSSREVISRLLKKMEDRGKIKMSHNTIIIL